MVLHVFKFSYICLPFFAKQRQMTKSKVELERHAYQFGSWVVRRFCTSWISWNTSFLVQPWFALCETRKTSPAHKKLFTEGRNRRHPLPQTSPYDALTCCLGSWTLAVLWLSKLLKHFRRTFNKSCPLDPMPTQLLSHCANYNRHC